MLEFRIFLDKKLIQRTVVSRSTITLGRSPDNDVILRNEHVSRLHAVIQQEGDQFRLEDKSTNGLLMDGQRISQTVLLPSRCRVEIYPFEIECLRQQESGTTPLQKKDIPKNPLPHSSHSPYSNAAPAPAPPPSPHRVSYHFGILIGESPRMQQIYRLIEDVAQNLATVLIRGEHGTGKELVAKAIHEAGPRRGKPFIAINCAAIPIDLIESELFGYEKGAFTGAQTSKKGKVEEADGGTLFLDEIGELSPAAQAKLLRFLQGKVFMRLGSAREIPVDIRVIAATNKDLERAVREETFRADLYYRIKVIQISVPPLRERSDDIPYLTAHILGKLAPEIGLSMESVITPGAMTRLQSAKWPGNIRQLENVLYSALIRSRPPYVLDEEILSAESSTWMGSADAEPESPLDTLTKQHLLQVLKQTQWDTAKAAEILKVSRGTIYYKLKKYGIDPREMTKRDLKW